MGNDNSEILKLTEKIAKDPKSKLFVPLAEEYKKAGDLDMAMTVLSEGLKNNPGYVTARSFLGKLLIEKGDLAAAQKEFEEVIKVIPDNLMAQRKLGDIYTLQNKRAEALNHYKTVLTLNPKDQDTMDLVADIEAGRDVKSRIAGPKPQVAVPPSENPLASQKQAAAPTVAPAVRPTGASTVPASLFEDEEPEEVLVVEPLEQATSGGLENELAAQNLGFLAETGQEATEPEPGAGTNETFAQPFDPFAVGPAAVEAESEETSFQVEEPEETKAEEPEKSADDFTTDTLAELYISQGFFEKAVDIYERMLTDNPNSQGLKNKLAKVRAMASEKAPATESSPETGAFGVPDEFTIGIEASETPTDDDANVFDEVAQPSSEDRKGGEERQSAGTTGEASGEVPVGKNVPSLSKTPATGRKETIDRLEGWLKNIKKEK